MKKRVLDVEKQLSEMTIGESHEKSIVTYAESSMPKSEVVGKSSRPKLNDKLSAKDHLPGEPVGKHSNYGAVTVSCMNSHYSFLFYDFRLCQGAPTKRLCHRSLKL